MNLNELRDKAYQCAIAHGWHEEEHSNEHEVWKDIPKYEGLYQVSNLGRVRSLDKIVCNKRGTYKRIGKIKAISNASYGYKSVGLCKDGIRKTGINSSDILSCLHGKLKTAGGYKWILYQTKDTL